MSATDVDVARYLAGWDARVCGGCQSPPLPGETLVVDQDAKTGEVRGLYCPPCYAGKETGGHV